MQIFKVGGSWVVTFSIRDRADRDIFRRVLGEQVGFVVILFVQIVTKYLLELKKSTILVINFFIKRYILLYSTLTLSSKVNGFQEEVPVKKR